MVNLSGTFDGRVLTVRVVYDGARDVAAFFVLPAAPGGPAPGSPGGAGAAGR